MSDHQMKEQIPRGKRVYFLDQLSTVIVYSVVVVTIPLLNNIIFPFMSNFLPNSRKRVGFGLAISLLSVVLAAVLYEETQLKYLIIPSILMGIAETSVFIPSKCI